MTSPTTTPVQSALIPNLAMSIMPPKQTPATAARRTSINPKCDGEGRKSPARTSLPIPTHTLSHTISVPFMASINPSAPTNDDTNRDNYTIVDSCASDNYLTPTANIKSKASLHQPIQVTLPDKSTLRSSHTCQLDLPLPQPTKQGYILPGMKNHSLISATKICDAGCKVVFS
eukprot:CCRYP_014646-RA/>CCRYP_014646-RA protein AED:0.43 eAED:0.43 QI:0/0/0/1/0/0/2/0/172